MFKPHILTKLIERSNLYEIRNLLLVGGEVSKNLSEILHNAYLFPKIEISNNGSNGLGYRILEEKIRLKECYQLIEERLASSGAYKLKLNPENIEIVKETEVSRLFTFVKKDVEYLIKIKLKKEIALFLNIFIENLRSKGEFTIRTAYVGSEIYFKPRRWYKNLIVIVRESLWIHWRDVVSITFIGRSIVTRSIMRYWA